MTDLSPAAQAVLDAFLNGYICKPSCNVAFEADRNGIAAALRAAAVQVIPKPNDWDRDKLSERELQLLRFVRAEIYAIAAELEAQ